MKPLLILIGMSILAPSCKDSGIQPDSSPQLDILEVAARHSINSNIVNDTSGRPWVYFLAMGRHTDALDFFVDLSDPDEALMQRFQNSDPPVKRYSQCRMQPVADKQTGMVGKLFVFSAPSVQGDHSALYIAEYINISQDRRRMYLTHSRSGWHVDSLQWMGSVN
jgi:hypothetical protein